MNRADEKLKIYAMMDKITEERSKLTDMYLDLLKRLEGLDEYERKELKESKEVKVNIEEDFLTQEPTEPVAEQTLSEIIDEHNRKYNVNVEEPLDTPRIPKIEIERELDKMPKQKYKSLDATRANSLVCSALKEKGIPVSAKELYELVTDKTDIKINISNFRNNILPRVVKSNPRIERAMRGYYQYK